MKFTLMILAVLISFSAIAQKDSTKQKKDTAFIPYPVFEKFDTVKVKTVIYPGTNGTVLYASPAYVIYKGFQMQVKMEKGTIRADGKTRKEDELEWQWTQNPTVSGTLFINKKPTPGYFFIIQ